MHPKKHLKYANYNPKPVSPVWYNSLQGSYEVGHHHIDALQVSTEERGRVEYDRSQNWSTDKIRDLETLNQDHVESAERGRKIYILHFKIITTNVTKAHSHRYIRYLDR